MALWHGWAKHKWIWVENGVKNVRLILGESGIGFEQALENSLGGGFTYMYLLRSHMQRL